MAHLIGIDLGTSTVKGALFDEQGVPVAEARRDIPLEGKEGEAEQDPYAFLTATLEIIRQLVATPNVPKGSVAGLCLDGQMGGAMAVDANLEPLTAWYPSSLNTAYLPLQGRLYEHFSERDIISRSGSQPILGAWLLKWRETPAVWQKLDKVMLLANWVAGRLAGHKGEHAFTDPSYLTWTGLADTQKRIWSPEILSALELDEQVLPRIVEASAVVGFVTDKVAGQTGLQQGTPIVAGVGDQVAGFIGAGVVYPGQLIDVSGTFPVFGGCLGQYTPDPQRKMLKPLAAPDGRWYSMMYISGGGLTHDWLRNLLTEDPDGFTKLMDAAASLPPGAGTLLAVPHFLGRACPDDATMRGAFLGLSWHHGKAHLYRALLEAVAYDYAQALSILQRQLGDAYFGDVTVIGGGAKNQLWNQIKSDVLGIPYTSVEAELATPLGSAIIAGHGVGLFEQVARTAQTFVQHRNQAKTTVVDPVRYERYKPFVRSYAKALETLKTINEDLEEARNHEG